MKRILLINDMNSVNMLLKHRIESNGFLVDVAETGKTGIEKAKENKYSLILLDYKLPDIDGGEVCRILKEIENAKDAKILFVSATNKDELNKIVKKSGADGYCDIALGGREVVEKIKKIIKEP